MTVTYLAKISEQNRMKGQLYTYALSISHNGISTTILLTDQEGDHLVKELELKEKTFTVNGNIPYNVQ